jgi:hypothetical protein
MIMKRTQQGMTVIETMAALAIATMLLVGLSAMIDSSLDDVKGQQTALHQAQVVNAANKYITANYTALVTSIAAGTVGTITIAQLQAGGFLSDSFSGTNAFNQTACVLVRQPVSGKLDALVATYGGMAIPERDIPLVAMLAGQGGGYISTAVPGTARGASWELVTTSYRNVACGGTTVLTGAAANDGGHLVSSLFYDGPGQLSTDFLYRNAVPGRPELNQMNTPIHMMPRTSAQEARAEAVEDGTDSRCTAASDNGKIAVDASGRVLSCQAGVWRRQGSGYWKDPVAAYLDLANLPASGNVKGDVRMVTDLNRAFTWNGVSWVALAVDQSGNLLVPGMLTTNLVKLNQTVVTNAACTDNGMIARDATGLILSCQSGKWRSSLTARLTNLAYLNSWNLTPSNGVQDVTIDLATLAGNHPLYLTGYATCHATGTTRAYAFVDMLDEAGNTIAYAGGCLSQLANAGTGVQNLGDIGLQKIPENITHLHVRVEPGAAAADFANLLLRIYSE